MHHDLTARIRPLEPADIDHVVDLSIRAWEPVFDSFRAVLGSEIYGQLYPDWMSYQADAVRAACTNPAYRTWVLASGAVVSGFVAIRLNHETYEGEIYMVAVDPAAQRSGAGSALTDFALEQMRREGMTRANVGTGGDPGHAAARATYEKAGFVPFPLVQFYKLL